MGRCVVCGESAGLFGDRHDECDFLAQSVTQGINAGLGGSTLARRVTQRAQDLRVPAERIEGCVLAGVEEAATAVEDDSSLLDRTRIAGMAELLATFADGAQASELNRRLQDLELLADCIAGRVRRSALPEGSRFSLTKGEYLIALEQMATYYKEKRQTTFQGASHGVSVRVMRGVYYRVGAFRGAHLDRTSLDVIDTGDLGITNKAILFAGPRRAIRIDYSEVVALQPYPEAFAVQRSGANSLLDVFASARAHLLLNLAANAQRAGQSLEVVEGSTPKPNSSPYEFRPDEFARWSAMDDRFEEAVALVRHAGRASTALLQRQMTIGYTRAGRLIDMMESAHVVGPERDGEAYRSVLSKANPDVAETAQATASAPSADAEAKRDVRSAGAAGHVGRPMKKCPDCAELVLAEAKLCRYCRHSFRA